MRSTRWAAPRSSSVGCRVTSLVRCSSLTLMSRAATAPDAASISSLIPALAVDGTLLLLAASGDLTVPTGPVIFRRTKIQGWPTGTPLDEEETLDFSQLSGVKSYIEKFPLDQIQTAYDRMMSNHVRCARSPFFWRLQLGIDSASRLAVSARLSSPELARPPRRDLT